MLHYLLGIVDFLAAGSLALLALGSGVPHIQAASALALVVKGTFYINDVLSVIDIALGITLFALLWIDAPLLALSLAIYLGFKGVYTFA